MSIHAPSARARTRFTLIELLVVLVIITILASMLLPALAGARARAKHARWTWFKQHMRIDGSQVVDYDFESLGDRVLNKAHGQDIHAYQQELYDGTSSGTGWTKGRWAGKGAMWFNGYGSNLLATESDQAGVDMNGDVTLMVWASYDALDPGIWSNVMVNAGNVGEAPPTNYPYYFNIRSDGALQMYWEYSNGSDVTLTSTSATNWDPGKWHLYSVIRDSETMQVRFYVDGQQLGAPIAFAQLPDGGGINKVMVGADMSSQVQFNFGGVIDDVSVFRRPLSATEIQDYFQMGVP